MTVNELMAHGKNFTEAEVKALFDEMIRINIVDYFDASCFKGFEYGIDKGTLVIYLEDFEGDWKHAHRCLNSVITRIAMWNGYDVDVHQSDYFNDRGDWYGCTHTFNLYHSAHKVGICMCKEFDYFNENHDLIENWYKEAEKKIA